MSAIALPKSIEKAFSDATDNQKSFAKVSRYIRSEAVLPEIIEHRKQFANVSDIEYRSTLEILLAHYRAGEAVGVNDLSASVNDAANQELAELEGGRQISKNAIRDSFISLLRDIELIRGDGRLTWAFLDTPSTIQKFKTRSKNMYAAYMMQTEHEAKLQHALRDSTALRKLEAVVLNSRKLSEDIGNELEYLKKQDKKHREQAQELGIPYSQIKEQAMKKQKKSAPMNMKAIAFPAVAISVILFGFIMSPGADKPAYTDEQAGSVEYYQAETAAPVVSNPYGLSDGAYAWRQRYIELFKENNGGFTQAADDELFDLAAEHMISRSQMEEIVNTITQGEVQ